MGLMPTVFTHIIEGRIPGTFVWKDDRCVAFMTINPIADGHVLVVPRDEIDHWVDCSPDLSAHLFAVAHEIGRAQMDAFACERIGLIVAGYEVPHTHLHVIPTANMADLSFANAASTVEREALEAAAARIRAALRAAGRVEASD
jgi:diadenosine tetraphosphate (Ap4A) HIT family hydrolase